MRKKCKTCTKICQTVVVRNDQANLHPTLNKGARGASLTIFVADCRSSNGHK